MTPLAKATMDAQEFAAATESICCRAMEKAFSKGLPIYFSRDQKLMAEYPGGRVEEVSWGNQIAIDRND